MAESIGPFLRWAGGKRWLAKSLGDMISKRLEAGGTYFEPFLGSGAVYFSHCSPRAVLSDLNDDLMNLYSQVVKRPAEIKRRLAAMPKGKKVYERIRAASPGSAIDRAVRFLYLNRNCYGGLYRENLAGQFNVPYGGGARNHHGLLRTETIDFAARLLGRAGIHLACSDFEPIIRRAKAGDVVYCDPTYRAVTREHFDRYGKHIFAWKDQERLAASARQAFHRGALVIVSNASCDGVRELYPEAMVFVLKRRKGLGPAAAKELLLVMDRDDGEEEWRSLIKSCTPRTR